MTRPPLPPFSRESAVEKVRLAEDGWTVAVSARGKEALGKGGGSAGIIQRGDEKAANAQVKDQERFATQILRDDRGKALLIGA